MHYYLPNTKSGLRFFRAHGLQILALLVLSQHGYADNAHLHRSKSGVVITSAADIEITGRVTGEGGDGLPGANILIKSTTRGSVTDANGNYKITVQDNENATLVFSLVGYVSKEVLVGTQKIINVALVPDRKYSKKWWW
jgi:hypothetical protein|uniref:carboxypeptidase-like regulatory domain-containing protein n=1 Tax=Dyadobacter sp. MSC1_007 TaxID=2909264 RepID=UPI00202DC36A|nr:carboxypeptidase-like regulatory domain-containing protein [Dyadobacter sp. MSC1_007]